MDVRQELNEGLKRFIGRQTGVTLQSARVDSYDAAAKTVDVSLHDGTVFYNVYLSPSDLDRQFIQVPKVGSWVLIGEISNGGGVYYVLVYSEIDKLTAKIGGSELEMTADGVKILRGSTEFELTADGVKILRGSTEFELTADGVKILRGSDNLKTVLDELFTELTTSFTAISAVIPIANLPNYALLKARLDLILK